MPGLFEQFPHTNLHELNLDWIIDMINQFKEELEDSAVLSVNGQTGHVTLYESENVILPPLPEGTDQWRLVRLVNGQYVGIMFYNNHAYIQRGNETMRLLTLEDIPSDSGVVSWNGLTGVVNVTGQDIPVDDSADADSIEQAITTETTERTNADNAIRNTLNAMSQILADTPQYATQMPISSSDATTVAESINTLNNKFANLGNVSSSTPITITTANNGRYIIFIISAASARSGIYSVFVGTTGTTTIIPMFVGESLTISSPDSNKVLIESSVSAGATVYAICFNGTMTVDA